MLEFKHALETLGFEVEAQKLVVDELNNLRVPAVILVSPPQKSKRKEPYHYIIVWPLTDNMVQVLDYPNSPIIISAEYWAKYLHSIGVKDIPVLLCGSKNQNLDDMLNPVKSIAEYCSAETLNGNQAFGTSPVTITNEPNKIPSMYWDFGDVAEGSILTHDFVITNETGKELHIKNLQKSCTCSKLTANKTVLMPGQKTNVSMVVSLSDREGKQTMTGSIMFAAEDKMPPVKLLANGTVHNKVKFEPNTIDFGICKPDTGIITKKTNVYKTEYGNDVHISRVACNSDYITASLDPMAKANNCLCGIIVSFNPKNVVGKYQSYIQVFSDGQNKPLASCVVRGEVYTDVIVCPSRLLITGGPGSNNNIGCISIEHLRGKSLSFIKASVQGYQKELINITTLSTNIGDKLQLKASMCNQSITSLNGNLIIELRIQDETQPFFVNIPFVYVNLRSLPSEVD
jgi:hypothetical protein